MVELAIMATMRRRVVKKCFIVVDYCSSRVLSRFGLDDVGVLCFGFLLCEKQTKTSRVSPIATIHKRGGIRPFLPKNENKNKNKTALWLLFLAFLAHCDPENKNQTGCFQLCFHLISANPQLNF
jgi:hypothetical protein